MSSESSNAGATGDGGLIESSDDVVISIRGVGKSYRMYESPAHRLWQGLFGKRKRFFRDFWALRGVSLDVCRGETMGIVGRNGSGKSTLLQMIAGTLTPTEGEIAINGRVAALLELGSGFNPEFTGRENVYLNAAILGLKREQVEARLQSILEFADIGEFIDQPVRSYSSGMSVRLAFAVIVHVDADVLIIDEALSVGDAFFSQKCMRFLRDFQKRGTLLFVSHDAAAVTNLCARAVWLENGIARMVGASQDVIEAYMTEQHIVGRRESGIDELVVKPAASARAAIQGRNAPDFRQAELRDAGVSNRLQVFEFDPEHVGLEFGAQRARITSVTLCGADGQRVALLEGGEVVLLEVMVELLDALDEIIIGFYVKDRLGQRLFGDNTHFVYRNETLAGVAGEMFRARFTFRMPVMPSGSYMVDAAVASGSQHSHTQQHWIHDALEFRAVDETMRFGLLGVPMLAIEAVKEER